MTTQESPLRRPAPALVGTRIGLSLGIAFGVCGIFLWTALESPLPATGWAAAFLFLAIESDVRALRIPNWLTFGGLALALGLAFAASGWPGVGRAAAGAGVALALLFAPFVLRWIGAGDVKALMVVGALWGPAPVVPVIFWTFVAGGAIALALLAARGELGDLLSRWRRSVWITLSTWRATYLPPAVGSTASSGLPFAVAIGLGASIFQRWGFPWA